MKEYIVKGGQKLRLGYTTGSCAAAAAKAATVMLLTGSPVSQVRLHTPKGLDLILEIEDISFEDRTGAHVFNPGSRAKTSWSAVSCAVRKDSGDDPDITNHALIYARVARSGLPGIRIDGGEGVGRVTKPGLDQPVGSAAINSTPRRMIREAVLEVLRSAEVSGAEIAQKSQAGAAPERIQTDRAGADTTCVPGEKTESISETPGLEVTIFVPRGRELAEKTFNPKLGIRGGISILGTTGIVEPMSDRALLDTIRVEIQVRKEEGLTILPAAPGNYGKNFFLEKYGFSLETAVTASNFICDTVQMAANAGFRRMLFVGHIGKLVKVAGGIRNTHSRYGDHRMEILTEIARSIFDREASDWISDDGQKQEKTFESLRRELADCLMTDEAINILRRYGLDQEVLAEMTCRIQTVMQDWSRGRIQVEVLVFSNMHGELGRTEKALEFMRDLQDQIGS